MFADLLLMSRGFTSAITRLVSRSRSVSVATYLTLPYVGSTVAFVSMTVYFMHGMFSA